MRVSVGVPVTVIASFRSSVSVIGIPAVSTPVAGEATTWVTSGIVVSICGPAWVRPDSVRLAALPAPSLMVAPLRLTAVADREAVFWPAPTV